jgi:hypothetical protein
VLCIFGYVVVVIGGGGGRRWWWAWQKEAFGKIRRKQKIDPIP